MAALTDQMESLRASAEIDAIVVTEATGKFVTAVRADETPPEALESLLNMAKRLAERPQDRAKLEANGESLFYDWNGRQVVVKLIEATTPHLLLLIVPRRKPYKRVATKLVKEVQQALGYRPVKMRKTEPKPTPPVTKTAKPAPKPTKKRRSTRRKS